MPYNPNVKRVSPEAGAEAEALPRQPDKSLEVTPEQRAKTAKMRREDERESRGKVAEIQGVMGQKKGAAEAFSLEREQAKLNTEQAALAKKVAELTGGMTPDEYLKDQATKSRIRKWFTKISGSEVLDLAEQWNDNLKKLILIESIKPAKAEEEYMQVQDEELIEKQRRPMTREQLARPGVAEEQSRQAMRLVEGQLKKLEARKAQIEEDLALIEPQIKDYLGRLSKKMTKQEAIVYNELKKSRNALQAETDDIASKTLRLMERMPAPIAEEAPEVAEEDIEEVSGVRRKPWATPPPISESPTVKKLEAEKEAARLRRESEEAFEVRKKMEENEKAAAEYVANVNKTKEIMGEARAAEVMDGVFTQMGLRLTGEEIKNKEQLWGKADQEQRTQAVNFVFKCSERQAAIIAGETRLQKKIEKELEEMAKAMDINAKLAYEVSGYAGAGVGFETGARASLGRTTERITGVEARETARSRARRTVNLEPPIEAITTEQAEAEEAVEEAISKYEAGKKAAEEEKMMAGARAAREAIAQAEKQKAAAKTEAAEVPEHIKQEAEIGRRMMSPMNIERTAAAVPKARALWDLVAQTIDKMDKELAVEGAKTRKSINIMGAAKEPGAPDAATAYVMAMGRYLEAANEPAPDYVIRAFGKRLDQMNKTLKLDGNALVQSIMAESGKKFIKKPGRVRQGAAQQEETRRRGQIL